MKKILIIDDDQVVARIYRNKFSVEGFQVEIAADGQKGLELIRTFQPDAVLLDLMLPGMNGVDLLKRVRSEPDLQSLPVIVFSNTYLTSKVEEAWKAGATKCLSKIASTPKQVVEVVLGCLTVREAPAPGPAPNNSSAPQPEASLRAGSEAELQASLRSCLLESLPVTLGALRGQLQAVIKAENEPARLSGLLEMARRVHSLGSNATLADLASIARIAEALEALLKELQEKPKSITPSTLRTLASAVDLLNLLHAQGDVPGLDASPAASVLVVDDEPISRRAVTHSLQRVKLTALSLQDPTVAFQLLSENHFELIILDVDMPGMSGFDLCTNIRSLPAYKTIPVIFVTSLNDLESRANSTMSGGTDFIAKPFLFMELGLKALVHVLRKRLEPPRR